MMSSDYLCDTNFASSLFVTSKKLHQKADAFLKKIMALNGRIYLSRIALAEVEFGFELNPNIPMPIKQEMIKGIGAYQILDIGKHTVSPYAQIRAALFDQKCPKNKKNQVKTSLRPEFFTALSPTAYELGIQENDLWMAAIAVERNMTLVTQDKMNQLRSVFPALQLEDWTK